jgi:hypothetical protein
VKLLFSYLGRYKRLLAAALLLATINQVFSLLDPQVFRKIVDEYALKAGSMPRDQFIRGVLLLLLAYVGVALVSRIAKNFQDYNVNVISQRTGAQLYERSVSHSFSLPYSVFEDQRSGEILQKMHKARADAQSLITNFINLMFVSLVGLVFVTIYAFTVHWAVGTVYLLVAPSLGTLMFFISRRIKTQQRVIVTKTAEMAGSMTETLRNVELVKSLGLEQQEINRLNKVNASILELELEKVRFLRFYSFLQGTLINTTRCCFSRCGWCTARPSPSASSTRCSFTRSRSSRRWPSWARSLRSTRKRAPAWRSWRRCWPSRPRRSRCIPCRWSHCSAWRSRGSGSRIPRRHPHRWKASTCRSAPARPWPSSVRRARGRRRW